MLKKLVILGVIGFVAVTALGGTKLASYIRSEINSAREKAEANIPPEKELARLRNEIKLLDKDIMTVINEVAKQRVAVKELEGDVENLAKKQVEFKNQLIARADTIKKAETGDQPTSHVTFGSRTVNLADAKTELEADVKRYTTAQKSLESMQALLGNRIKVRDSLEKQLEAMKTQKAELTAAVDDMEAQLAALKLQQMESKYQTDDTRLAQIKEDLRKLRTKVDVEKEKLKLMPVALDSNPAPATSTKSVDGVFAAGVGSDTTGISFSFSRSTSTRVFSFRRSSLIFAIRVSSVWYLLSICWSFRAASWASMSSTAAVSSPFWAFIVSSCFSSESRTLIRFARSAWSESSDFWLVAYRLVAASSSTFASATATVRLPNVTWLAGWSALSALSSASRRAMSTSLSLLCLAASSSVWVWRSLTATRCLASSLTTARMSLSSNLISLRRRWISFSGGMLFSARSRASRISERM